MLAKTNHSMTRYINPIDRIFDDVLTSWSIFDQLPLSFTNRGYRIDVVDQKLRYEIDLPGLKPSEIQLTIEGDEIVVQGTYRSKEIKYRFTIDKNYDILLTTATMDAGMLTLLIPESSRPEPKKIEINITK